MADDGSGADITIPSFLLYKPDADAIKAKLRETDFVQVGLFTCSTIGGLLINRVFGRRWTRLWIDR